MDNNLLQADIARLLDVCEDTVTGWEMRGTTPTIEQMPGIIKLVGYVPVEIDASTLAGKVKLYRYIYGMSQKKFAKMIGVDGSTICSLENGTHKTFPKTARKVEQLLKSNERLSRLGLQL